MNDINKNVAVAPVPAFNPYKFFLEEILYNFKKDFNDCNYSLVYNVNNDGRMTVAITDSTEKKLYTGISSTGINNIVDFLGRKLSELKA